MPKFVVLSGKSVTHAGKTYPSGAVFEMDAADAAYHVVCESARPYMVEVDDPEQGEGAPIQNND